MNGTKTEYDLKQLLQRIDHKSYPAYKDTKGCYQFGDYIFSIDHVQGDPFAAPSDVSVHIDGTAAGFPKQSYDNREKRVALSDHLLRRFGSSLQKIGRVARGSGKSGVVLITNPGQEILERTACQINERTGDITVRFQIGFPANGRTINSRELNKIIYDMLPDCIHHTFYYKRYDEGRKQQIERIRALAEDQTAIRRQLNEKGLVAFVANGSVLPRETGTTQSPMNHAVVFSSPESMTVAMELPNRGTISGMGIHKGVTLIVGGGYHGKSTLLQALERGVYNHIAGDGRELVITDNTAMKIRAEDGRCIHHVDISAFIRDLPNGKDTIHFTTEDASGSTSQAAGVIESVEAGTQLLLLDEDTSATNFMIRDELMQRVVSRDQEPIIPFIDRIRELYESEGISTILVAGSSGAYFHVADTIIQMDQYRPVDITARAKQEAREYEDRTRAVNELVDDRQLEPLNQSCKRIPLLNREFDNPRLKMKTQGMDAICIDHDSINVRLLEQLVDNEQLTALGMLIKYAHLQLIDGKKELIEIIDLLEKAMDEKGLECLGARGLARPRRQEIYACINRYTKQRFREG